jgi:hypothetical protein
VSLSITEKIFQRHIKIEYSLEQGTLIQKAKVVGAIVSGLYLGISEYPAFREGAIKIYHDAEAFSTAVMSEFKKATGSKESDVIYKRTVPKDVTRLRRVVDSINAANERPLARRDVGVIRNQIIQDIAALYRSDPSDLAIPRMLALVPDDKIPDVLPVISAS